MLGMVEFSSGKSLPLQDLVDHVPSTALMGETNVVVSELLAKDTFVDDLDARRVFINAVSRKSPRSRAVSALITLCHYGDDPVTRVESDFIDDRFAELLGPEVQLACHPAGRLNLLPRQEVFRFLCKSVCHRIVNFLGSLFASPKGDSIVRAWVDTTDATFPEEVQEYPLLIFPFTRRISRQIQYLRQCRELKREVVLTGIPYRLRDMIRVALDWKNRDRHITLAEKNGFERMADRWIRAGVKNVFTTDEFEVASCILHDRLRQSGVRTVNRSHGVSTYGPYVSYSVFRCHTIQQIEFYGSRGDVGQFELVSRRLPKRLRIASADTAYDPVFIYLFGSWQRAGKLYEAKLELESALTLARVSRSCGIPMIGKAHPNTTDAEIEARSQALSIDMAHDLPELENRHPIFLTLLSSAYFNYLDRGPVLIFTDNLIRPQVVFGDQIETVPISNAGDSLCPYLAADHWIQTFERQIALYEQSKQSILPANEPLASLDPLHLPRSKD